MSRRLARPGLALAAAFAVVAGCQTGQPWTEPPPACRPMGRACDAGGVPGTCTSAGDCAPIPCKLGQLNCCVRPKDCAAAQQSTRLTLACDTLDGACKAVCAAASDCSGSAPVFGDCTGDGCACDTGLCVKPPCTGDAACSAGERCIAGACAVPPRAARCEVVPAAFTLGPNVSRLARVLAWDASGHPTVGTSPPTWSLGAPSVGTVDASGTLTGGTQAGTTALTATVDDASCSAPVTALGLRKASTLRVRAIDPGDAKPVAGLLVRARQGATVIGSARTGLDGVARVPNVPESVPLDVDVLDVDAGATTNGRAFVSILGTRARSLLVAVPPNPDPNRAAGLSGKMTSDEIAALTGEASPLVPGSDCCGDVHLSVVGLSYPGDPTELDLPALAGPFVTVHIKFGSLIDSDADLYTGVVIGLGTDMFKPWYAPVGAPGRRTVWALAANLELTDTLNRWMDYVGSSTQMPAGGIAFISLPMLARRTTWASVRPSILVPSVPLSGGSVDPSLFPQVPVAFHTRLDDHVLVTAPPLPSRSWLGPTGSEWLDGELLVAGVFVEGQGFVPLGLTIAPDVPGAHRDTESPDGIVENDSGLFLPDGTVDLRFAPKSGGLEGLDVMVLVVAADVESLAGGALGDGARAGRLEPLGSVGLGATVDISAPLLALPTGATYSARTATATFPDAAAHRVIVTDQVGRRWILWAPPGTSSITVPDIGSVCPVWSCADPSRSPARVEVQALTFRGGLGYDDLVRLDGTDLDREPELVSGFSTVDATQGSP